MDKIIGKFENILGRVNERLLHNIGLYFITLAFLLLIRELIHT